MGKVDEAKEDLICEGDDDEADETKIDEIDETDRRCHDWVKEGEEIKRNRDYSENPDD